MREIKFRAWDKIINEWVYFTLEELCNEVGDFSIMKNWCQYTGLKDKNGKGEEIYVGDLLKDPQGNIGEVFYLAPSFAIRWKRRDGSWDTDCCFGYGEIIGTAMENKELLEGE